MLILRLNFAISVQLLAHPVYEMNYEDGNTKYIIQSHRPIIMLEQFIHFFVQFVNKILMECDIGRDTKLLI